MLSNTVEPSTLLLLLPSCALQLRKAASCVAAGLPPVRNSAHQPTAEQVQLHQLPCHTEATLRTVLLCTVSRRPQVAGLAQGHDVRLSLHALLQQARHLVCYSCYSLYYVAGMHTHN
jgi:hypothetical protein